MYLPTEPDVVLAFGAMARGCAVDCWHCRAWARLAGAIFPFPAWALATPAEAPGPPSGRVSAGIGGGPGSSLRGSGDGPGRLRLLEGGRR